MAPLNFGRIAKPLRGGGGAPAPGGMPIPISGGGASNPLSRLQKDYVLQRALGVVEGTQKEALISKVRPRLAIMRRYSSTYSRHLTSSIEHLLQNCGPAPEQASNIPSEVNN